VHLPDDTSRLASELTAAGVDVTYEQAGPGAAVLTVLLPNACYCSCWLARRWSRCCWSCGSVGSGCRRRLPPALLRSTSPGRWRAASLPDGLTAVLLFAAPAGVDQTAR
jgi:hypothetical protein